MIGVGPVLRGTLLLLQSAFVSLYSCLKLLAVLKRFAMLHFVRRSFAILVLGAAQIVTTSAADAPKNGIPSADDVKAVLAKFQSEREEIGRAHV